ncbi:hypothetical secreted protein [Pseudomonas knackmussii B13]|uniref:Hypothetical secreted protein n=1 Tax=Pseudomonas knackmussii (strain DSM 6978 / CCUG 54928 / LMG 23759 / B13) TaxID=1301098 RepID=A0A024HNR2_PSEKB|nr:hypothetical protein [Pseudomonas knackmussii]CDF86501.1 hypothetical secreted protein [Pseudomonas knackmussii B13]
MRIPSTHLRRWLPLALLTLLGAQAQAAAPVSSQASLIDANRYLLLLSATGDERFQTYMENTGKRLDASLAANQDPALRELWSNFQQGSRKLVGSFATQKLTAQQKMSQSLALEEPVTAYLKAHPQATPTLADNLRLRALLAAREANLRSADPKQADAEAEQIKALDAGIQQQIDGLAKADPTLHADLSNRWHYLQVSQKNGKLLPYPFNAQIDAMLGKLDAR